MCSTKVKLGFGEMKGKGHHAFICLYNRIAATSAPKVWCHAFVFGQGFGQVFAVSVSNAVNA